ncbi:MAG: efflux transporter periplasmic adaptor subunit, partial [Sphingomonadales bacterium 32-68-7]
MPLTSRRTLGAAAAAIALIAGTTGYFVAEYRGDANNDAGGRRVLYWYDPMVPSQHFEQQGKSPFMDMQLVPRYADEGEAEPGVRIDPARTQNLGVRVTTARMGTLDSRFTATGTIDFNERDVAIVQARASGFVQKVHGRAPGDVIAAGAPLVDLLVPEWGGAQAEYLAVRRTGDEALTSAAR